VFLKSCAGLVNASRRTLVAYTTASVSVAHQSTKARNCSSTASSRRGDRLTLGVPVAAPL